MEVADVKRLMIVTDNSFAAQSIRLALRQTVGFQLLGFVDGMTPIGSRAVEARPEIVLVDEMQEFDCTIARLEELAANIPDAKRILLALRMDDTSLAAAFEAGAEAVISKSMHPVSLATVLREISRDAVVHAPHRKPAVVRDSCPLTDRELEILRLVAQGYTNGRIARELWVTEQTVKFHLSNTYRKLGVANRTEASRYAHLNDLMAAA
jgi:DNA-binding NarL/FixJ family response regulator